MNSVDGRDAVEIEKSYYLMRVYNNINESATSLTFIYQSVLFWRTASGFVMEYEGRQYNAGDIVNFDEFEKILLQQKLTRR